MNRTKTKGGGTHSEALALIEDLGLEVDDGKDAELRAHKELEALIDELGLEVDMISVELDSECATELALGGLLHARTDETNI